MESTSHFLLSLLECGERAANIARKCRLVEELNCLLVEEKTGEAKNKPFVEDFKTLADVLIQASIQHELTEKFPFLAGRILGEEDAKFTNTKGETISIELTSSRDETARLLSRVLEGNESAAKPLAEAVHEEMVERKGGLSSLHVVDHVALPMNDLALWIDPIDNTSSYVKAYCSAADGCGMHEDSLQCVAVVIGAFERSSGRPLVGVVNQPFYEEGDKEGGWMGRSVWGLAHSGYGYNSLGTGHSQVSKERMSSPGRRMVVSRSEDGATVGRLKSVGYDIRFASGAGYKLLCVIDGTVCGYLVSRSSTFKWDTCGADAILRSMGGAVVYLKSLLSSSEGEHKPSSFFVRYDRPDVGGLDVGQMWRNEGGILAVCDLNLLDAISKALKE